MDKKRILDIPVIEILGRYNIIPNKDGFFCCPMHNDSKPSATISKHVNKIKCFVCNSTFDNIDILKKLENKSYKEVVNSFGDSANNSFLFSVKPYKKTAEKKKGKTYAEYMEYFTINKLKTNTYLKSRGLDPATAKKHLLNNNFRIGIDRLGKIIFDLNTFAVCKGKDYKGNWGSPKPIVLLNKIKPKDNTIFICEGIEDALTGLEMGYHSISLNSISNLDKLLKDDTLINIAITGYKFAIALDNDNAGIGAMEELIQALEEKNIQYELFEELYASKCKDLNEYYINLK